MLYFHIITLFPDAFRSYINASIVKRALEDKKIAISFYNPRDFTEDKHRRVDRRPYGGGPGMVLAAEPILRAVAHACGRKRRVQILLTSPRGRQFTAENAREMAKRAAHIVIIAGRYEGIDARVKKILHAQEISAGPYVLTGGELPTLVMMDAIARHVPGVLGAQDSLEETRVTGDDVYTRPEILTWKSKKYRVPNVLLSGNHKNIDVWKQKHTRKK